MSLMENSNTQVVLDDQLQHFIETETKKQQFQVSFWVRRANKFTDIFYLYFALCNIKIYEYLSIIFSLCATLSNNSMLIPWIYLRM